MSWQSTTAALSAALLRSAPHDDVTQLVAAAVDQIEATPHVRAATWHPSGFGVIPLLPQNDELLMRIHIWPTPAPARPSPDWPIHNHTWAIDSRILCGALTDETVTVTPDPHGTHVLYAPVCGPDGVALLTRTETRVAATLARRATYLPGQQYHLEPDLFHVSVPATELTATVAVMTRPSFGATRVLGDLTGAQHYRTNRLPIPPAQVLELLKQVRTAMRLVLATV